MIKNIIFDIGNVLVDFAWDGFVKMHTSTAEEFERTVNASIKNADWNEIDRGILTDEEILNLLIDNDPGVEGPLRAMFENFHDLLRQFDYTKQWIKDLKARGFKVYCLSNMPYKCIYECADSLDFIPLLDGCILSCYYKVTKPEKAIYDLLFDKFDLVPGECVFFDDLEKNILSAKANGMEGIVFKSKEQAEEELTKLISLC